MEEIEAARAPWLVPIERQNLINWRTKVVDGREVVTMAVFQETFLIFLMTFAEGVTFAT